MTQLLPRDEDGQIVTSAIYGLRDVIVEVTYHTQADGRTVQDGEDTPRTLHGPFTDMAEAEAWMNAYPDGDTDISDMVAFHLNAVREAQA